MPMQFFVYVLFFLSLFHTTLLSYLINKYLVNLADVASYLRLSTHALNCILVFSHYFLLNNFFFTFWFFLLLYFALFTVENMDNGDATVTAAYVARGLINSLSHTDIHTYTHTHIYIHTFEVFPLGTTSKL